MKALIDCTGFKEGLKPLINYRPSPLMPVVGKSTLFYIFDFLVRQDITDCALVLSYLPNMIEEAVKEGQRWGLTVDYFLVQEPTRPFTIVKSTAQSWDKELIVVAKGDELPIFKFNRDEESYFMYDDGKYSGWGVVRSDRITSIDLWGHWDSVFKELDKSFRKRCDLFIRMNDVNELRESNIRLISQKNENPLFPSNSKMAEPGIWISRGVQILPGVTLNPPVFIGENVKLGKNTSLGPNLIIEKDCIIDSASKIKDSVIAQNSYVGENLEISDSYVDKNLLIDFRNQTQIKVTDTFILSELNEASQENILYKLLERVLALLMFIIFSPITLFIKNEFYVKEVVLIPGGEPYKTILWKSYKGKGLSRYFRSYPVLWQVILGNVHFVGSTPRTIKDVEEMPPDWRKLYLTSRLGLITLADLDKGQTSDERYASEAYYAVHRNFLFDVRCFFRWLKQKLGL